MTGKNIQTKHADWKAIFTLITAFLMCFVMLFSVACSADEEEDDSSYTKTETDEQIIVNGDFEYRTADSKPTSFPVYSGINWSRSTDNSASSSAVNSGIVDTDDFDTWFDNLYEDSDFVTYLNRVYQADVDALGEDASDADVKATLKEKFGNPGLSSAHAETDDASKILMINNIVTTYPGYGTAQKFTNSGTITMEKNTYGKISVWVKTQNLKSNLDAADEYGANVNLTNTLSGVTQEQYQIRGIRVTDWTQYTVYVKANDFMNATLKLVLGLGYGSGANSVVNCVEGTAYFDDAVYEEIDKDAYNAAISSAVVTKISPVSQTAEDVLSVPAGNRTVFAFDMDTSDFFSPANITANGEYVVSPQGISGGRYDTNQSTNVQVGTVSSMVTDATARAFMNANAAAVKINANYASYEVSLGNITVPAQSYSILSFYLKTDLEFNTTGLSFYIIDQDGNTGENNVTNTMLSSITTAKVDESLTPDDDGYDIYRGWSRYTVILKNNFVEGERSGELILNVGPTDANEKDRNLFAKGTVTLADFVQATGTIPSDDEKDYQDYTTEDQIYSLINGAVDSSSIYAYALFAGYTEDYDDSEDDPDYKMTIAPSNEGVETSRPAAPAEFIGVDGGSVYVNQSDDAPASSVNKNANAGIINTKYLANYTGFAGLADLFDEDDNLQPLMIYNQTADAYGYLSSANSLSANSFTVITVRVKVVGDAKAYLYLVNTDINSDGRGTILTQYDSDRQIMVEITSAMMDTDGWATVQVYYSAGNDAINYRVELWNGTRDGNTSSTGYVFFDDYEITTSNEASFTSALDTANNEGYVEDKDFIRFTTTLTEEENEYNNEYYKEHEENYFKPRTDIVWAKTVTAVDGQLYLYVRNDTLNRTPSTIPTDTEEPETGTGCQEVDHSTFWISLSSIILAVALLSAIIALIVKKVVAKRRKNKSDAESHYNVRSRNKTQEVIAQKKPKPEAKAETPVEPAAETEENAEEYQYGEVLEEFDDTVTPAEEAETAEPEETTEETAEEEKPQE